MEEGWITKAELMERIQASRLELDGLLGQLSEYQMIEPVFADGWSAKDVVAHITAWEQRLLSWLAMAGRGETPQIPAPGYTWDDMDLLNEQTYYEYRHYSLEAVMASYRASLGLMFAALERLTDDDLNAAYFGPAGTAALWKYFAGCTYEHYVEHGEAIRAWLEETGGVQR